MVLPRMTQGGFHFTSPGVRAREIVRKLSPRPNELVLAELTPGFLAGATLEAMFRFRSAETRVLTGGSP